jgi:L-alanine-DL-glutamate epimerase-like enolase superfamily enzyme
MVPREGKNESWDLKPGTTYAFFDQLKPMYEKADAERKTASYAGIDIAATDAWASATSRPGCSIFGQQPPVKVPLVAPIGGGTVKKVSRLANAFKWLGFREFKLKTGQDDDAARLRAVRKAIGPDAILWVDANAAWSLDDALAMRDILKETNVSFIEQPCPACHPETLAHIQQGLGIPVMADESLCTRADAEEMLRRDIKIWNVRLAKIGGYSGMLEMLRLAGEHSVKLYLGILVGETSAMAAAQRACLGLAKFFHVEYGFPRVLLKSDPFREGPAGYFGHCSPLGSNPGLGVRLLPDVL